MRHQNKVKKLGKPQDQRKALLRSLATALIMHGGINVTMPRAKVLKAYADRLITFAKKDDLHSRRQALKFLYDQEIKGAEDIQLEGQEKTIKATVLRKLFSEIGPKYKERNGGYTRIYRTGHRRGDNAEMALIQLV